MRRLPSLKRWMTLALCIVLAVSLAFLLGGCGKKTSAATGFKGRVRVSGSTTLLSLIQEAAAEFGDANPRARVDVQGGGSSVGITQLNDGIVDIADSSRELQGEELKWDLVDNRIAFDIIAIVVNPGVTVRNLSSAQVKAIFTGRVKNWKSLGGPDKQIVVVVRDQASGTREVFDQKALGSTKDHPVESEPTAIESSSNGVVREVVATTGYSIGYLSYGFVNKSVRTVKVNGVPPDVKSAINRRYTIARWLHMFTKGEPSGTTKGFIDFVLSPKFQKDIVSQEYIEVQRVLNQ
jgi:phosphate transport system substrate-binding protein